FKITGRVRLSVERERNRRSAWRRGRSWCRRGSGCWGRRRSWRCIRIWRDINMLNGRIEGIAACIGRRDIIINVGVGKSGEFGVVIVSNELRTRAYHRRNSPFCHREGGPGPGVGAAGVRFELILSGRLVAAV